MSKEILIFWKAFFSNLKRQEKILLCLCEFGTIYFFLSFPASPFLSLFLSLFFLFVNVYVALMYGEINGFSFDLTEYVRSPGQSFILPPLPMLSRAHDRCSAWENEGGKVEVGARSLTGNSSRGGKGRDQRRQGEGRQKRTKRQREKAVSSRLTSTRPSIPPRIPVHYRPYHSISPGPLHLLRGLHHCSRVVQLITLLTAKSATYRQKSS